MSPSVQIIDLSSHLVEYRFDFIGPVFQQLPSSLAKRNYRCPTASQGPLQDAYDTKLAGWEYILDPKFSDLLENCNTFMKGRREGSISWLDFYPFAENVLADAAADPEAVLVVDVGGGLGHGLVEINEKFSQRKGRLILQDHPKTIEQAGIGAGIFEPMAHDFFKSQPVQGMDWHMPNASACIDSLGRTKNLPHPTSPARLARSRMPKNP